MLLSVSDMVLFPPQRLYIQIQYTGYSGHLSHTHAHKGNTSTSLLAVRFINWMFVHSQNDLGLWREVKGGRCVSGGARERVRERQYILIQAPEPNNCRPT